MTPEEQAAQDAIRRLYGVPILYTGAGLDSAPITAIPADAAGAAFTGPGATIRQMSFEIDQADLIDAPRKGDIIVDVRWDTPWRVIERTRRDDIGAWVLVVER
ncbi:MAG: hypothetical protein QHC65_16315 [Sphingomonas sp.]|nr:hypothetical protein [Sphingomonas sp.]MDX3885989.1 hypothetical protein [Sphingomonas sp.]